MVERAVVTWETERIKGSNPLCLWRWWILTCTAGQRVTGAVFSQCTVVFPCQHNSTNTRSTFIHVSLTSCSLENGTFKKKCSEEGRIERFCFYWVSLEVFGGGGTSQYSVNLYTMKRHIAPRAGVLLPPPQIISKVAPPVTLTLRNRPMTNNFYVLRMEEFFISVVVLIPIRTQKSQHVVLSLLKQAKSYFHKP